MKLLNLFVALAAATETTASVGSTAAPSIVGATEAEPIVLVTEPEADTCTVAKDELDATTDTVEKVAMHTACELACADVEGEPCGEAMDPADVVAAEACKQAQEDLEATTNSLEKVAMQGACEIACADVEGEACGFMVNGLSFVLFAIMAIFKY